MLSSVALVTFATASTLLCDDVSDLGVPVPLGSDTVVIDLDGVSQLECPTPQSGRDELAEVLVTGGTLTLSSDNTVRFVNVRFTVEDGASLVFDMPTTEFGPNGDDVENPPGFLIDVKEGGSVTFTGDFVGQDVDNVRSMFFNAGSMEFKGDTVFEDNGNVFRSNSGDLKFRGDTVFRNNGFLPLENIDGGFVRFSKTAIFDTNARAFDGGEGCAVGNRDPEGTVIFRGDATFTNHACDFGGAVANAGKMRFYTKAYFNDNRSSNDGGAVINSGSLIFGGAAQFNRNQAEFSGGGITVEGGEVSFRGNTQFNGNQVSDYGGGISIAGGDVTFKKSVLFSENEVFRSGAAFSVSEGGTTGNGSLTFNSPDEVEFVDNIVGRTSANPSEPSCTVGFVEEGSTLVGFPGDDVCVDKFA